MTEPKPSAASEEPRPSEPILPKEIVEYLKLTKDDASVRFAISEILRHASAAPAPVRSEEPLSGGTLLQRWLEFGTSILQHKPFNEDELGNVCFLTEAVLASRASSEPLEKCHPNQSLEYKQAWALDDLLQTIPYKHSRTLQIMNAIASAANRASAEVRAGAPPLKSDFVQDLRVALCNVSQVFDGWHNDGTAWSEWDESVRKKVGELQQEIENYIRPAASSRQAVSPGVATDPVWAMFNARFPSKPHDSDCLTATNAAVVRFAKDVHAELSRAKAASPAGEQARLSFEEFSRANRQRCESPQGFNHKLSAWSTSDWITAVMGELGEAANVVKKLNRYRDGVPGNKLPESELRDQLRKELGDVFVYLDLIAQSLSFSIADAAVEVFNAKSRQIGYSASPATAH